MKQNKKKKVTENILLNGVVTAVGFSYPGEKPILQVTLNHPIKELAALKLPKLPHKVKIEVIK